MLRSILPQFIRKPLGIKEWHLNEDAKKEITDGVNRTEESEHSNIKQDVVAALFNIAQTAIGGAMFYFFQNYDERHDSSAQLGDFLKDKGIDTPFYSNTTDFNFEHEFANETSIVNGVGICLISGLILQVAYNALSSTVFATNDIANGIKGAIKKMSPDQLNNSLEAIQADDLHTLSANNALLSNLKKMQLSYMLGGLITQLSNAPEDEKYLVFAASKSVALELINFLDDKVCSKKAGSRKLFSEDFLAEFSTEEKQKLQQAVKSEIEANIEKDHHPEYTRSVFTNVAKTLTFFSTVHAKPLSSTLSSSTFTESSFTAASDFALASLGANLIQMASNTISNHVKVRPDSDEISIEGDVEMGNNRSEEIATNNIPHSNIRVRSKSEGDLVAKQQDVSKLLKSNSEANLLG